MITNPREMHGLLKGLLRLKKAVVLNLHLWQLLHTTYETVRTNCHLFNFTSKPQSHCRQNIFFLVCSNWQDLDRLGVGILLKPWFYCCWVQPALPGLFLLYLRCFYGANCRKGKKRFNFTMADREFPVKEGCHSYKFSQFRRTLFTDVQHLLLKTDLWFPQKDTIESIKVETNRSTMWGWCWWVGG